MRNSAKFVGVLVLSISGCAAEAPLMQAEDDDGPATTGDDDDGDTLPDPSGPPPTTMDPSSGGETTGGDDTETDGCSFVDCDDPIPPRPWCDVWEQDCPPEEKCVPYANDNGPEWNSTTCVPIAAEPGEPGDECQTENGPTSGFDTCNIGAMCWATEDDGSGVCLGMCDGNPDDAFCEDADDTCVIANGGVLNLCMPSCLPLLQDCPVDTMGCYPSDGGFVCVFDSSGEMGGYGDPCAYANACDAHLLCAEPALVPGCAGAEGCCTEYCDADPLPGEEVLCSGEAGGQECIAFFEEGEVPSDIADAGYCGIPQ